MAGILNNPRAPADRAAALLGGRIDVLVNNAGIFPPTTTTTTDAWHAGWQARAGLVDVDCGRTSVAVIAR